MVIPQLVVVCLIAGPSTPSQEALEREATVDLDAAPPRKPSALTPPPGKQRFAVEFKLGPYVPEVDRGYDGPGLGPYATIFGETDGDGVANGQPRPGVMPALGFEWQFFYAAGRLAVGLQVAYFRDRADALLETPADDGKVRSEADKATFGMVPLTLQLIYRFEFVADYYRVPLVPYVKFGPTYSFWWSRRGDGNISVNSDGDRGTGGVWGWQLNAGLMFRLDFIEKRASRTLKQSTGVDHTYLYAEYQLGRIRNFGVGDAMSLGDSTFFAGLAVEF